MNIEECQLTDREILTVLLHDGADGEVDNIDRRIANSATEKALRSVLRWLQEFEGMHSSQAVDIIRIGRGHGLEMAADELEAMLVGGGDDHAAP